MKELNIKVESNGLTGNIRVCLPDEGFLMDIVLPVDSEFITSQNQIIKALQLSYEAGMVDAAMEVEECLLKFVKK